MSNSRSESERFYWIEYAKGWVQKLQECCSGRNVHELAQIKTVFILNRQLLERDDWLVSFEQARGQIRNAANVARKHYNLWLTTQKEIV